jgi:alkanesulfonate monooxygenase SsuD/methylene tetrahydromethanopterin reductase-like flavin-dependent oxidoreductase (luciferase family)
VGWDASVLGQVPLSPGERADRFAEFVELTDQLLLQPQTSYRGVYYAAHEARSIPGCVQQPRIPFAIAAAGPRGMRLAAGYGESWVTTGDRQREGLAAAAGARVVAAQIARLEDACAAVGRDPATLRRMVLSGIGLDAQLASVEALRDTLGRYQAVGVTDFVLHWPRDSEPYAGERAHFERVISALPAV